MAFIAPSAVVIRGHSPHFHRFEQRRYRLGSRKSQAARMLASGPEKSEADQQKSENPRRDTHVSVEFANQAIQDAIGQAGGDVLALAQSCACGFTEAFVECYTSDDAPSVFVVCGAGLNGLIGLQAAVDLKQRGYEPVVYAADGSKYVDIAAFCAENGLDLYHFIPSTFEFYFQVVIDALLGTGFDGGDIWPRQWPVYDMLVSTRLAIASVDVPSGWDLKTGPRKVDVTANTFIKPEVLVSLGAPKECAKMFSGGYHFLAGRHLPRQYYLDKGISIPMYPGKNAQAVLISSNPFRFSGDNGEAYGKPGRYNATLYTKNPRFEWVDIEEDMELWDELE